MKMIDMTGFSTGRLVVVEYAGLDSNSRAKWMCKCSCGNEVVVSGKRLRNGHTRSCGCLQKDSASAENKTHGMSKTLEYKIWKSAKARCINKGDASFPKYGARGISFSHEWDEFERFISDMGPRPSNKHSLERINNNGPYSRDNCKWATASEQAINKRNTAKVSINGEAVPVVLAAKKAGIPIATIKNRVWKGMTTEQAFFHPKGKHSIFKISNHVIDSVVEALNAGNSYREVSRRFGISKTHVARIAKGYRRSG